MSTFEERLEAFCRGDLSSDGLVRAVRETRRSQGADVVRMRALLTEFFQSRRLPAEMYYLLNAELEPLPAGPADADDDKTRLAHPAYVDAPSVARGGADEATRLASGADVERTRLIRPTASAPESPEAEPAFPGAAGDATAALARTAPGTAAPALETVAAAPELGVGSVLKDRFILEEVLGRGGMGVVYKALDLRKQEAKDKSPYVALKVLNDQFKSHSSSLIALQREAKKAQELAHPNIINVYDFDRDTSHVFMSMEMLDGQSLDAYVKALPPGGVPFKKAWYVIKGLCLALAYAHKKGIVHSDFKPNNVFLTANNEVKVLDFGIACAVSRQGGRSDETVFNARDLGALTPAYASLEMFGDGEPDPRDDIYALACVCYELLTGKHPFGKLTAQKALELGLQPKVIPGLSRRQWKGLQRGLAFRRKDRTPSVEQFLTDIQPRSSVPLLAGLGILAVVLGGGGYAYLHYRGEAEWAKQVIALTPEQRQRVRDFLELAKIHYEVGYLTAPTGSNAAWAYRQVLTIDPYNEEAMAGLKNITGIIEQQAVELYREGRLEESLAKVEEGLEVIPDQADLLALKEKIMASE